MASARAWPSVSFTSAMTTFAPSRAKTVAVPPPIPVDPPVTTATFPWEQHGRYPVWRDWSRLLKKQPVREDFRDSIGNSSTATKIILDLCSIKYYFVRSSDINTRSDRGRICKVVRQFEGFTETGIVVRVMRATRVKGAGTGAGRTLATPSGNRSSSRVRFRMLESVENVDGRTTRSSGGESGREQPLAPAAHRANAVCPVKVEALLGIGDREDVAVIDGVIIRLRRTGLRQAGQEGEPASARKTVAATLDLHLAAAAAVGADAPVELAVYRTGSARAAAGWWVESADRAIRAREGDSVFIGEGWRVSRSVQGSRLRWRECGTRVRERIVCCAWRVKCVGGRCEVREEEGEG